MIVKLMIIGHLLGDFYIQTDKIAKEKKDNVRILITHCLWYVLVLATCSSIFLTKDEIIKFLVSLFVIGIFHGIIDSVKILIEKKSNITSKGMLFLFILDQIVHFIILILVYRLLNIAGGQYIKVFNRIYDINLFSNFVNMIMGILICGRPASILIRLVFSTINQERKQPQADKGNPKIGSYIGILERVIIFFFGMMGQYSAIGFVLTAKSVARYKQLEDQAFAEKYLVGTLLSSLISIACVGIYNYLKI